MFLEKKRLLVILLIVINLMITTVITSKSNYMSNTDMLDKKSMTTDTSLLESTNSIANYDEVESSIKEAINQELNNQVNEKSQEAINEKVLAAYPIGSIYVSTSSTNPSEFIGGEWESYGQGRTLVGVDSNDSDFSTVEKLGGEKTHTLTIDEMPSHNHVERMFLDQSGYSSVKPAGYAYYIYSTQSSNVITWANAQISNMNYWRIGDTEDKGGSQAHNNLQPYITTYMWKRTA